MFFVCKRSTAYDMRISDWSSDVCSSDLSIKINLASTPLLPFVAGKSSILSSGSCFNKFPKMLISNRVPGFRTPELALPFELFNASAGQKSSMVTDRKSVVWGKGVSVRVDLGVRRILKKKE